MTHLIHSGEAPAVGLRVIDYDRDQGTIVKVSDRGPCGPHCNAWHTVRKDNGATALFNCTRLTTVGVVARPTIVVLTFDPREDCGVEVIGPFENEDKAMAWVDRAQPTLPNVIDFSIETMTQPFIPDWSVTA